jgi:2-methylcitrate dehydratase PrpD
MGSDAKALIASQPSVDGTKGAFLAAGGLEGAPGILEDRSGFWAAFKKDALRQMFSGFGRAWVSESLSYKIYPGCAYLDTAQDALFEIAAEYRKSTGSSLAAEDIESVRVEAGMLTSGMETMSGWYRKDRLRPTNMNFSVALTGALSILAGHLRPDLFEPAYLDPMHDRIVELAQKFSIVHSPELTAQMSPRKEDPKAFDLRRILSKREGALDDVDFSTYESRFPAVVTLRLKSGKSLRARQDIPLGGAGRPREETRRLVKRKLAEAFASSPEAAEAIGRFIENLEGSEDAAELASLSIGVEDGTQEVTTRRPLGDTE